MRRSTGPNPVPWQVSRHRGPIDVVLALKFIVCICVEFRLHCCSAYWTTNVFGLAGIVQPTFPSHISQAAFAVSSGYVPCVGIGHHIWNERGTYERAAAQLAIPYLLEYLCVWAIVRCQLRRCCRLGQPLVAYFAAGAIQADMHRRPQKVRRERPWIKPEPRYHRTHICYLVVKPRRRGHLSTLQVADSPSSNENRSSGDFSDRLRISIKEYTLSASPGRHIAATQDIYCEPSVMPWVYAAARMGGRPAVRSTPPLPAVEIP
jgi:hypothetical protein